MGRVIVRDTRVGRDSALVTDEGGEVLAEFEDQRFWQRGDRFTLPNGEHVEVLRVTRTVTDDSWITVLFVGDACNR
jgi:hypothetical protein